MACGPRHPRTPRRTRRIRRRRRLIDHLLNVRVMNGHRRRLIAVAKNWKNVIGRPWKGSCEADPPHQRGFNEKRWPREGFCRLLGRIRPFLKRFSSPENIVKKKFSGVIEPCHSIPGLSSLVRQSFKSRPSPGRAQTFMTDYPNISFFIWLKGFPFLVRIAPLAASPHIRLPNP